MKLERSLYLDDDVFYLSVVEVKCSQIQAFYGSPEIKVANESILVHVHIQVSSERVKILLNDIFYLLAPLVSLLGVSEGKQFEEEWPV